MTNPNYGDKYVVYIVLDIYPCSIGGMEIFYSKHLLEICKHTKVALVTCCQDCESSDYIRYTIPRRILNIKGSGRIAKIVFTAFTLFKLRKNIKYIHVPYTSNSGNWGIVFPLLRVIFRLKYVLYIHAGGMGKWRFLGFDEALFKYAEKIIGVSKIIKYEYEKRVNRNIDVIFPINKFEADKRAKNEIRKEYGILEDEKILIFIGSLKKIKNPDILLSAFILLGIDFIINHKLKLVFVGDGPLRNILESKVNSSNLRNYVLFTGYVKNSSIPGWYRMADYYIICSEFEGTPISLLEAMYNGLPIIGSRVDGIENVIKHEYNGLLFESKNIMQLKEYITSVVNGSHDTKKLTQNAKNHFKENFSGFLASDCFINKYEE